MNFVLISINLFHFLLHEINQNFFGWESLIDGELFSSKKIDTCNTVKERHHMDYEILLTSDINTRFLL